MTQADESSPVLLVADVAAKLLGISSRMLWNLSAPRGPIPCVRLGRAVRYDKSDLIAFANRAKVWQNNCDPARTGDGKGE